MRVKIISIHLNCGWYDERELFEGKEMILNKQDEHYRFDTEEKHIQSITETIQWDNEVGFEFHEPKYVVL